MMCLIKYYSSELCFTNFFCLPQGATQEGEVSHLSLVETSSVLCSPSCDLPLWHCSPQTEIPVVLFILLSLLVYFYEHVSARPKPCPCAKWCQRTPGGVV